MSAIHPAVEATHSASAMEQGAKPTPQAIAARCRQLRSAAGTGAADCRYLPDYAAKPLVTRAAPR